MALNYLVKEWESNGKRERRGWGEQTLMIVGVYKSKYIKSGTKIIKREVYLRDFICEYLRKYREHKGFTKDL